MPVHKTKSGGYQWGKTEDINYLGEIWCDIDGFDGIYQVSNFGRIRKMKNAVSNQFISTRYIDIVPAILNPYIDNHGYPRIGLSYKNTCKHFRIHRLVALAFIPNPKNFPEVNHIDENKYNNHVDNLEWCTKQYNSAFGTRGQRIGEKNRNGKGAKRSVLQYDKFGNFIRRWKSMQDVHDTLGLSVPHICQCCRNQRNTCGGFVWKYEFPNERD